MILNIRQTFTAKLHAFEYLNSVTSNNEKSLLFLRVTIFF